MVEEGVVDDRGDEPGLGDDQERGDAADGDGEDDEAPRGVGRSAGAGGRTARTGGQGRWAPVPSPSPVRSPRPFVRLRVRGISGLASARRRDVCAAAPSSAVSVGRAAAKAALPSSNSRVGSLDSVMRRAAGCRRGPRPLEHRSGPTPMLAPGGPHRRGDRTARRASCCSASPGCSTVRRGGRRLRRPLPAPPLPALARPLRGGRPAVRLPRVALRPSRAVRRDPGARRDAATLPPAARLDAGRRRDRGPRHRLPRPRRADRSARDRSPRRTTRPSWSGRAAHAARPGIGRAAGRQLPRRGALPLRPRGHLRRRRGGRGPALRGGPRRLVVHRAPTSTSSPTARTRGSRAGLRPLVQTRRLTYRLVAPFHLPLRIDFVDSGGSNVIGFFIQPETEAELPALHDAVA